MEQRKNANKEQEWAFLQVREKHKSEPWAKIIDNCEMGQSRYSGTKDVTRLRQAMLARKSDLQRLNQAQQ